MDQMGVWGHTAVEGSKVRAVGREGACCCPLGVRAPGAEGLGGKEGTARRTLCANMCFECPGAAGRAQGPAAGAGSRT